MANSPLLPCLLVLLVIVPFSSSYRAYYDKGVDHTVYDEVLKFVPDGCDFRIDIVARNNVRFDSYAWYAGRIIIYDGNNLGYMDKVRVLKHEIGHLCNPGNRRGSYFMREKNADLFV